MERDHYYNIIGLEVMPFNDYGCVPMAADEFHLYSEPTRFGYSEDMNTLPFIPDQPFFVESFYSDAYSQAFSYNFQNLGIDDYSYEPAFIRKRNERERQRVKCVNEGYAKLRNHLPDEYSEKRLSKVETLRAAIKYIKHLQSLLSTVSNEQKEEMSEEMSVSTINEICNHK
uniref:Achaete-scute family bHLH transcription factor 3 n=1 Tax=Latimeria chalumnae TaxID=7897 RepID=H3BC20_LATCH